MSSLRRSRRRAPRVSLWRLLAGEVAWATRQALHPMKTAAAAAVALGAGILLGPSTPGPVLGAGWRLAISVMLGFVGLSAAHALLQRRRAQDDAVTALRTAVAVVVVLLVGTAVLAYLLAAITGAPAGTRDSELAASLPIDGPILGIAALLLLGVLSSGLGRRLAVPSALVFMGLGMLVADDGLGLVRLDDPQLVQSLAVVALVIILFDGGLGTSSRDLRLGLGPGLALATLGVGITAGVTALGAMALLDVPSRTAWLLGAIVASTDATAVFALLRRAPVPERVAAILQVESGANDPIAILLTVGLLAAWDAPPAATAWLGFGGAQLLGGIVVGAFVGWAGARALTRAPLGANALYPVMGLALAGLTYGVAAAAGASGFLATYVAGIVLGAEAPRRRGIIRSFFDSLSSGVEVGLFLLLGLLVFPSDLPGVAAVSLGLVALLVFVARPLAVAVSLAWFDTDRREVGAIAWLGMRGAVPIVLATLAFSAGIEEANTIFDVVFFVVLASMLLQGVSAPWILERIGLSGDPSPDVPRATALEGADVDIVELDIPASSPLSGRRLRDAAPPPDLVVVALQRGDRTLVARGDTDLRVGDRIVVATPDRAEGWKRVQEWVTGAAE